MSVEPILEFKDVSLRFGESWALRNISLTLEPGETRIIFGAAGSGKTTLLKAVIGLVQVDEGSIHLYGQDVTKMSENELFVLRRRAGVLFQEGGLFDSLTVGENVEYPLVNQPVQKKGESKASPPEAVDTEKLVRETLRFVELEQTFNKFPSEISGGMRRRVGIARAVVTEPLLVLYDSPTAGLDPITANTIMALLAKERDVRNSASLVVTHRYQDGEIMANFRYDSAQEELLPDGKADDPRSKPAVTKFMVMKEGEIVFLGTREELESSNDEYVKRFVRQEDRHAQ
jgi:phospholipid/cholesterol/gamma-HCH transport system ATP-binding protein